MGKCQLYELKSKIFFQEKKSYLKKDDVLKFGKKLLKVLLIEAQTQNQAFQSTSIASINSSQRFLQRRESIVDDQIQCRICLESGNRLNPLVSPCLCDGSVKYIHFKCLKTWIQKNIKVFQSQDHISFFKKQIKCEMCKGIYETEYDIKGKFQSLYDVLNLQSPFIILEFLQQNEVNSNLCVAVSFVAEKQIFVGRNSSSQIRFLNEQSISRTHAKISYDSKGKHIILEDLQSRYGTLVQLKKNIEIGNENQGVQLQIASTMMELRYIEIKKTETAITPRQTSENDSQNEHDILRSKQNTYMNSKKTTDYIKVEKVNEISCSFRM